MKKILFQCQYFKVRVRDILIIMAVLVLLFFGLRGCQNVDDTLITQNPEIPDIPEITEEEKEKLIEEKLVNVCDFTKSNINDFYYLLERTDLCSEKWFKDLNLFIERIDEQNQWLQKKTDKNSKSVYKQQESWLREIRKFQEKQNSQNIESLEKNFQEYKKYYERTCLEESLAE